MRSRSVAIVPRVPQVLRYVAISLPGFAFAMYVFSAQRGAVSRILSLTHRTVIRAVRLAAPHRPSSEKGLIAFAAALGLCIFLC